MWVTKRYTSAELQQKAFNMLYYIISYVRPKFGIPAYLTRLTDRGLAPATFRV